MATSKTKRKPVRSDTGPPDRRAPLDRGRVLAAAVQILDSEGPDALSYRRLAANLDAGVATLYWHVANKTELMELVLDLVLSELDDGFDAVPDEPWQTRLRDGMLALWSVLRRHPWAARQAITSAERSPNMLRFWDRCADLLFAAGFGAETVAYALSTLRTFVIGNSTQNAVWHTYGAQDTEQRRAAALGNARDFFNDLPADAYPQFRRLVPVLADHDEQDQFLRGVDLILDGLDAPNPSRA